MPAKQNALSCYRLILMIPLLLTLVWAIPTVPIEVDSVTSTTAGVSSACLQQKGYKLSGLVIYHSSTNYAFYFSSIKLTYSSICGGPATEQCIGDCALSGYHTHSTTVSKQVTAVRICYSNEKMTDFQLEHQDGTTTKVSAALTCPENRLIDLTGKNMIGMTLLVTSETEMQQANFSIWVDNTENITENLSIGSQVPDTTYTLNQGLFQTSAFTVIQDSACNLSVTYSHSFTKADQAIAEPSWITFNSTLKKFSITITASADVGVYIVTSTATVAQIDPATGQNKSISKSFTLTVQSLTCPDLLIPTPTVSVGQNLSITFTPVMPPQAVSLVFLLKRRNSNFIPSFIVATPSQDGLSLQLAINPTNLQTDVATWDSFYVSVSDGLCQSNDFTIIVPACSFGTMVQTPSGITSVSQLKTVLISFTTSQTPSSACVGAVFSVGALPSFVTWNASSNTLTAFPTLSDNNNQYTVQVNYGVPQVTPFGTILSIIQVTVCKVTSLTTSDSIPSQSYILGAILKQTPTPQFVQSPQCNEVIYYSINSMPTFISKNPSNIRFFGNTLSEANVYNLVLKATAQYSQVSATVPFTVNAIDCTPKNFKALPDSQSVAQLGQVKNLIALSMDLAAVECGQYTYSLVNDQPHSFVTIQDLTLDVQPYLTTAVSSYKVKAQVKMQNDPFLSSTLLISIAVTECQVLKVIPDKILPKTEIFFVGGPEKLFELPKFTQSSACQLALTLMYSDTNKSYTDSMVIYDLVKNKLIISATLPSQALSYKLTSTAKFQELPNVSDTQVTDLKVVSAQCTKMRDANYAIKANAVTAKQFWNLNDTGSLVTSENFDYTQVKIEMSQQPAQSKLPTWFAWNAVTRTFSIESNKKEDAGSYIFTFLITSTLHEGWKCQIDATLILTVDSSASAIPNLNKIKFEKPITSSFDVKPGDGWSYQLPKPTYFVVDKTVDVQNIKIGVSSPSFIVFNSKALLLVSSREFTEKDENVKISITLYDELGQTTKQSITLKLPKPLVAATEEETPEQVKSDPAPVEEETPEPVIQVPEVEAAAAQSNAMLAKLKNVSTFEGWKVLMKDSKKERKPDEPILPTPEISVGGVSSLGILTLKFSSPMQVPLQFQKPGRMLKKVEDAVKVQMLGNLTDYTWNITDFTPRQMEVAFYFQNASQVSINNVTDVLTLTIIDSSFFKSAKGYKPRQFMIAAELPKQIQLGSTDESAVGVAASASTASQGVVIGNLILSIMLSASLNQLWSMVEAQQIIVMFPMFFIGIPPVPAFFIAKFLEIANFDVLPVQDIWGKIFYMPPCYQLGARYNAVGMGDTQFVGNIGSLFVTVIIVQLMMIAAVLAFQLKRYSKRPLFKSVWAKLKNDAFWVVPIQTLMESSMVIVLSSLLVLQHTNWESTGQKVDTVIGYTMGISIILFTIWSTAFMIYHRNDVTDALQNQFGPLWEELDTDNTWIPFYRFAFLFRRIVLSAAIVLLGQICFQLQAAYFQSLLMIITIGQIEPFIEKSKHIKEMTNEVIILFSIYFVMCFSQLVPDDSAQNSVGYGFCAMLAVHIVVNISIIIFTSIRDGIRQFKRWYFLRQHMKAARLAMLLLDRKKIKQNARSRIENSRKGHEQQLDNELEQISKMQQLTIENEKIERKRLKNEKLIKKNDIRLPTIQEEEEEEIIDITKTLSPVDHEEQIIDTTSKKLKQDYDQNSQLLTEQMDAQLGTDPNEEEEKKSAFIDTWDQEEEKEISEQALHVKNQQSKALHSASHFFDNIQIQHQVQNDSINQDYSADLIVEEMLDDEAGYIQPISQRDDIIYPMNCTLERPTIIKNPNTIIKNINFDLIESQMMHKPNHNPQKKSQNVKQPKQSWGLQTLAALKFAGIEDIRKRK